MVRTFRVPSYLRVYFSYQSLSGILEGVTYSPRPTRYCDCGEVILSSSNRTGRCRRCITRKRKIRLRELSPKRAVPISLGKVFS